VDTISIQIRWAAQEDIPARWDLIRVAWDQAYAHIYTSQEIEDVFHNRIEQKNTWQHNRRQVLGSLVAEVDGQVVGTAGLALLRDGDGEVTSLYVHPDWQSKGVGTALWNGCVDALRDHDCSGVQVWVLENAGALAFYRRRGCLLFGEGYYWVGRHTERALCCRLKFKL
jgi:ribosomal protein S18 acetylase RimI-like enzyme